MKKVQLRHFWKRFAKLVISPCNVLPVNRYAYWRHRSGFFHKTVIKLTHNGAEIK
ncbi:Uncharacterized protein YR821_0832 [Yersinia ruckeri]|nr:Uncharacterized protein YR821_0832 [Yersinia ruckeri]